MKFEIKQMSITPEIAAEMLKMNTNNRSLREKKVAALAASMAKGEWVLSNDAIVISEGNVLLNGQHRLQAVIKSGVACPFIVYTGAQEASFDIMDTPTLRSMGDVIQHRGGKNTTAKAATVSKFCNLLADHENMYETLHRFSRQSKATRREMTEVYEKFEAYIDHWHRKCDSIYGRGMEIVPMTTMVSLAMFLEKILNHPEEKILAFIEEMIVDGACRNSTILYARKKLIRNKMKIEKIDREDVTRYVIRAWNDFLLGKQVQVIKANEDAFYYIRPF